MRIRRESPARSTGRELRSGDGKALKLNNAAPYAGSATSGRARPIYCRAAPAEATHRHATGRSTRDTACEPRYDPENEPDPKRREREQDPERQASGRDSAVPARAVPG